ncbi:UNVERIFIED_CONTAM: hypothetical protein Scaly_1005100 [Sesamum calycinum]|uniref:Uncharacterized protein n=1 Tax=Sesamum calycinum TaxID=2727403 RepID=A0AAW2QYX3_9LAMI
MDVCHESNFAAISALQLHIPSSQQTLPSLPVAPFPELESILSPPKIHLQLFDGLPFCLALPGFYCRVCLSACYADHCHASVCGPLPRSPGGGALPSLPIKHLSPLEMHARRVKGLCFNCDERFVPGHRCKPSNSFCCWLTRDVFLECPPLLDLEDVSGPSLESHSPPVPVYLLGRSADRPPDVFHFQLSADATSGSSHNILQSRIAHLLGLPVQPVSAFSVLVGNGTSILCSDLSPGVPL